MVAPSPSSHPHLQSKSFSIGSACSPCLLRGWRIRRGTGTLDCSMGSSGISVAAFLSSISIISIISIPFSSASSESSALDEVDDLDDLLGMGKCLRFGGFLGDFLDLKYRWSRTERRRPCKRDHGPNIRGDVAPIALSLVSRAARISTDIGTTATSPVPNQLIDSHVVPREIGNWQKMGANWGVTRLREGHQGKLLAMQFGFSYRRIKEGSMGTFHILSTRFTVL